MNAKIIILAKLKSIFNFSFSLLATFSVLASAEFIARKIFKPTPAFNEENIEANMVEADRNLASEPNRIQYERKFYSQRNHVAVDSREESKGGFSSPSISKKKLNSGLITSEVVTSGASPSVSRIANSGLSEQQQTRNEKKKEEETTSTGDLYRGSPKKQSEVVEADASSEFSDGGAESSTAPDLVWGTGSWGEGSWGS